ncbi:MAG: hypothetical protein LUH05_04950 [Candidatus Gastranaerophilales bacterium]|nr:hypothetical protein [Candidatus Gastranaerophilales bacterium]
MKVSMNVNKAYSFKGTERKDTKLNPVGTSARDELKNIIALTLIDGAALSLAAKEDMQIPKKSNPKFNKFFNKSFPLIIAFSALCTGVTIYKAIKETITEKKVNKENPKE